MNFGHGILISFFVFFAFMGSMVFFSLREDVSLVSKNYYQEELNHSEKMQCIQRTMQLDRAPRFRLFPGTIQVTFLQWDQIDEGELTLIRPSDVSLDVRFLLTSSKDSVQVFQMPVWKRGPYRVKMNWKMDERSYCYESLLVL